MYIVSVLKIFSVLVSVAYESYWYQSFQYKFEFQLLEYHLYDSIMHGPVVSLA